METSTAGRKNYVPMELGITVPVQSLFLPEPVDELPNES